MYRKRPPILFPIFPKIGCSLSLSLSSGYLLAFVSPPPHASQLSFSLPFLHPHPCNLLAVGGGGGGGFPHTPASHIIRREGASIPLPFLPLAKWSGKVPMYKTHQCDDGRRYGIHLLVHLLKPTFSLFSFPHLIKKPYLRNAAKSSYPSDRVHVCHVRIPPSLPFH